jgi:hypothetical protein
LVAIDLAFLVVQGLLLALQKRQEKTGKKQHARVQMQVSRPRERLATARAWKDETLASLLRKSLERGRALETRHAKRKRNRRTATLEMGVLFREYIKLLKRLPVPT